MNIGDAARRSGVSPKMIRYYEQSGLIRSADRTGGNYRTFSERDVEDLSFIRRARLLGFPLKEITELLSLGRETGRAAQDVRAMAAGHAADLRARVGEMQAMAETLQLLADDGLGPRLAPTFSDTNSSLGGAASSARPPAKP